MKLKIVLFLLICSAGTAPAQVTKTTKTNPELQKLVTRRKVVAVKPLLPAAKLIRVRELLKGKIAPRLLDSSTMTDVTTLTVATPISGNSFLTLNLSTRVAATENTASFQFLGNVGSPGVAVGFTAPADGYYVFDFSGLVLDLESATGMMTFQTIFSPAIQQQVLARDQQHFIFITNQVKAGLDYYFVGAGITSWDFYSVSISQFKVGQ